MSKKELQNKELEVINSDDLPTFPHIEEPTIDDLKDSSIKMLTVKQQRVVHMYLSGGLSVRAIAEAFGYNVQTIHNILAHPNVKRAIEEIQLEDDDIVRQGIKAMRMKAMTKMYELMDSNQPAIVYQAARDILDRTGHKGTVKQEVNVNITFEEQLKEVLNNTRMIEDEKCDIIEIEK